MASLLKSHLRSTSERGPSSERAAGRPPMQTRLIPSEASEPPSGGILMNDASRPRSVSKDSSSSSSTTTSGASTSDSVNSNMIRKCSFKEPLPTRPDKDTRRSSISMGVAARASLLSNQNSGNSFYQPAPQGYNPNPEHLYSPSDIIPGIKKAWKRMAKGSQAPASAQTEESKPADEAQLAKEQQSEPGATHDTTSDKASSTTATTTKRYPDVFEEDDSSPSASASSSQSSLGTQSTQPTSEDSSAAPYQLRQQHKAALGIAEDEGDEGAATPRGSGSRRASFDAASSHAHAHADPSHRWEPNAHVLGFDYAQPRNHFYRTKSSGSDEGAEGTRTPTRGRSIASPLQKTTEIPSTQEDGEGEEAGAGLSRKASTGAPATNDSGDGAPPLRRRRTETENEEAHAESLNTPEKKCHGRLCV